VTRGRIFTRTTLAIVGLFVVTGCGLTSCGSKKTPTFTQSVNGENGGKSTISVGNASQLPKDFPVSEVPLPARKLIAVLTGSEPPNKLFNLTFRSGGDGRTAANEYRDQLDKAGFKIANFSSTSGSDGGFTQFDASNKNWDLVVVGGRADLGDKDSFSVQVTTHGSLNGLSDVDGSDSSTTTTTDIPGGP
jgi:hypothetical protein